MATTSTVVTTAFETYSLGKQLGQGGAGRVYAATDGTGKPAAIKIIDLASTSAEKARRFKNELMFCLRNQHPNILTVSDFGTTSGTERNPFYVMPLFAGTLRTLIDRGIQHTNVLPLFAQILDGVEAAHKRGVVHRDLKPENVLYDQENNRLVIADFGVARFTEEELATLVETKPSTRLANFQYAAPEQRAKNAEVDQRADIFALGLMLHEMFTGQIPQGTGFKPIASVANSLAYLDDIADRMIRHSTSDRFDSIADIKSELIARENVFVHQQKLDKLRNTVVPAAQVSDPLISDPPEPESVDYDGQSLVFTLTKAPSTDWISVFKRVTGVSYYPGQEPGDVSFSGREARMPVSHDGQAQSLVPMFKEFVKAANRDYATKVRNDAARAEQEMRRRLREKLEAEERRLAVARTLKL